MNPADRETFAIAAVLIMLIAGIVGVARSAMADAMADCRDMCGSRGVAVFVARVRNPQGTPDVPERCECASRKEEVQP